MDLQVRVDIRGDHAGAEAAGGPGVDAAVHDQAHVLGAAQVEVVADGGLEPGPAGLGRSNTAVSDTSSWRIEKS